MDTTVKMQKYFWHELWPLYIALGLILIAVLVLFFLKIKKKRPKDIDSSKLKWKYKTKLDEVLNRYYLNKITEKEAFQKLSNIIRHFVYEKTGIKVINCTLEEIKSLGIENLTVLISECYPPEFMKEGRGNVPGAIEKAKKVIESWN